MNIEKLKRDLKTVQHALSRDQQGYDADGYDSEGKDRYGRSREMMERSAKYERMAFDSLTPNKQALVLKANQIYQKYEEKAIEWESQLQYVKQQSPFYEEYEMHSPITKHSFLTGLWITKQEDAVCTDAFHVLLEARRKFDPYYGGSAH